MGASFDVKRRTLVGLGWLNLGLATASLARHIPPEFFSFYPEMLTVLLDRLPFLKVAPTWIIPILGLFVAMTGLVLTSGFLGTRLVLCSETLFNPFAPPFSLRKWYFRLFWSTAIMAGGWGMLVKTEGFGFDHFFICGFLTFFSICTLCLNLNLNRNRNRNLNLNLHLRSTHASSPDSAGVSESVKPIKNSRNSYKNPVFGMDFKIPIKTKKRATIEDSNPATRLDFSFLRENFNGLMNNEKNQSGSSELFRNYEKQVGVDSPKNVQNDDSFGESQPEKVQGGPRRSSASEPSKIFAKKSTAAVHCPLNVLPVLDEEIDPAEKFVAKRGPIRRCSERFQHAASDMARRMGMGERIARLIGGTLLGFFILFAVSGLVIVADGCFSVSILKDLARVFRKNIATFKKIFAVEF